MILPIVLALGTTFNPSSSYTHDFSIRACRQVEVKKVCSLTVESTGYGSKGFVVFQRDETGEMEILQEGRLDVAGKRTISLKFGTPGAVNIVVMLFDKQKPVAMDGADILVIPDHNQLGEQSEIHGETNVSEEEVYVPQVPDRQFYGPPHLPDFTPPEAPPDDAPEGY